MKSNYTRRPVQLGTFLILSVFIVSLLAGCSNTGAFIASNRTNVDLGAANYKIVATDVAGESHAGYILGLTWNTGVVTSTFALARVLGSDALYRDALHNLWQNYEAQNGSVDGKKLALINVRYDSDNINVIFYTEAHVSVRADVIEFVD